MMNKTTKNTHIRATTMVTLLSVLAALRLSNLIFDSNEHAKKELTIEFETKEEKIRTLQTDDEDGEYIISWNINVLGKEYLLNSPYLKAGFEQVVKDYINNDLKCEDENDSSTSFYNVEVIDNDVKRMLISGSGKCKGRRKRCRRQIKETISDAGRRLELNVFSGRDPRDTFCQNFRASNIFESFQNIFIAASFFNYYVDVNVITDLVGNLNLDYKVSFESSIGDGLNEISNVTLDPSEPEDSFTTCVEPACSQQKETMKEIFNHFDIPIIENQHECAYEGINCDQKDKVTYIWMGKFGFNDCNLFLIFLLC